MLLKDSFRSGTSKLLWIRQILRYVIVEKADESVERFYWSLTTVYTWSFHLVATVRVKAVKEQQQQQQRYFGKLSADPESYCF